MQLFDVGRVCSLFDVVCNASGAAIGIRLAISLPSAISDAVSGAQASGLFRLSGVIALLYLWAGYQLFPVVPALSQYALRAKLEQLFSSGTWSLQDFLESVSGWLAFSALAESPMGKVG